jgi:hypothetical protein
MLHVAPMMAARLLEELVRAFGDRSVGDGTRLRFAPESKRRR